jgi:type I restriction enzyme M protein
MLLSISTLQATSWWATHSSRLADLPAHGDLNAVRAEFLKSFVASLLPFGVLDRFRLAGVIATWWTDTLPDLKTLRENNFAGAIDGWIDGITDALEDDDATGPAFDPLGHKLVRRTMGDYLEHVSTAKANIARLKGDKEGFEQSNAPDESEDEEVAAWNYAKDLERRMREVRAENRDALRQLNKLEKAAARSRATDSDKRIAAEAKARLQPMLDKLTALEVELAPYEQIKEHLAKSRAQYRELTGTFVKTLRDRCAAMNEEQERVNVLDLFAHDIQVQLDVAVAERRNDLIHSLENLWNKYATPLNRLSEARDAAANSLAQAIDSLGYDS